MLSVNLPINTNFFNNNSLKTFTKSCNKASENMKSTIVSKLKDLDLAKSKSDATLSDTSTPSYSVTTTITTVTTTVTTTTTTTITTTGSPITARITTTTTAPSVIPNSINPDRKETVHEFENLNTNIKGTELVVENTVQDAVQLSSCPLDEEYSIYNNSPAEIDDKMSEVSSFDETEHYESDEESIFDPLTTTPYLSYKHAFGNAIVVHPKISLAPIYEEPIVAQFFGVVEAEARVSIGITSIDYPPSYVLDFFRMVENDQHLNMVSIYDTNYIAGFLNMAEKDHYSVKVAVEDSTNYIGGFFNMVEIDSYLTKIPIPDITNYVSGFLNIVEKDHYSIKLQVPDTIKYVSGFFNMAEEDHYSIKPPILDSTSYTSDFFKMIEKDQEFKELRITNQDAKIDFIWLQIYKILSNKSFNQRLQLFELSQLEITKNTREITPKVSKNLQRKRIIPKYDFKHLTRRPRTLQVL